MKIFLGVVLAGAVGTGCRFLFTRFIDHTFPGFPWGVFVVNMIGAFAAGFIFMAFRTSFKHADAYMPILLAGFLGAFTTFSAYALESVRLIMQEQYIKGFTNILVQNVIGLLSAGGGIVVAKFLFR